ncbi:hypothetical protein VTN96DRAFT_3521 [Rasamsonia emersonii]|uniref:Glucan endo-1,3-alpha-glucosidase agn1 n=1 Tax=Rasamsonia emersonii (strain ATCC 16479 / CBS 393.64 / IMI 116815) TaxID=1408163 RepID=A0A0F4YRP4_RASE3|nr:hypothetical protein T310_4999 [Rasamsonia emersonii CBS 393.64]KKA20962.1 hypothetical protein T310_4999 [Rasamsonia emersonii CBS 393.64]
MNPFLYKLFAASVVSAAFVNNRDRLGTVEKRAISQGWSLQSSVCPSDTVSCGNGGCCPSTLYCNPAATDQVSACCLTASDCRGEVENAPTCADSSWSLWQGLNGNDFCCETNLVGVYNADSQVAGSCVASTSTASATPARLMSTGSGSPATSTTTVPTSSSSSQIVPPSTTATSTSPPSSETSGPTGRPVFFHYMIGTITDEHCEQDIRDAQALGVDAFALNLATDTESWAIDTVQSLFKWATIYGFKLFFSFDMTGFSNPNQFTDFLLSYVTNSSYYYYNGLPLVSTFNGGASSFTFGQDSVNDGWKVEFLDVMEAAGHPVYFVPAFQDVTVTSDFFNEFPSLNGAMNWNSWPFADQGDIIVPTTDDITYLNAARAANKTFMMGVSPLQFKHMDSSDNWYRRGEENLEYRFGQVLQLQPDMVELQTWNDAGESHYMGNSWPEPIAGTNIPAYTENYDHTAYQQVLPAFIKAYKSGATTTDTMYPTNGKSAQGVFWHHTLLAAADCSADSLGDPSGIDTAQDFVTAAVLVGPGIESYNISIWSGNTFLGSQSLSPGFNGLHVSGLTVGTVVVNVTDTSTGSVVISGTGPIPVTDSSDLCNYNFQVVALT